ncbi:TRAP transporter small permease subunit [Photobacterium sp. CCB-ST2H9]|uniref:TRAP transporter small permease subunit n=1 Tax=Photobacterium sp. CCB-ST2H9 TaxID=2912855 RepID=UPI002002F18B|nr:TRAP transporter small permease subunit [Photobacterium sp. CCB-ST2H9]UTM56855.1 TRAP transporter small permease subunit [Photobacterium sp. CCB-ST2H9]
MNTNPTPAGQDAEKPRNCLDAAIVKIGNLLSLLFIFTVIISFYEVLMRYVFDAPTIWVHETASFIGGSLFIVGGLYALATDKHVRVVLLYDMVSPRTRQYLNVFHHIMGLLFSVLMAWASYTMAHEAWLTPWGELRLETSGSAWNPPFPALLKGIIFVCLCVLSVQFLLHLIAEIRGLRKKDV